MVDVRDGANVEVSPGMIDAGERVVIAWAQEWGLNIGPLPGLSIMRLVETIYREMAESAPPARKR
jgi:hypothetical protein